MTYSCALFRIGKGLAYLGNEFVVEKLLKPEERFLLKNIHETYWDIIDAYEDEMQALSKSKDYSYAPGRLQYRAESITFYYKGAEVIYIFPWERFRKDSKAFIDTKYGYTFNDFYEYVKLRYAKEDFEK